VRRLLDVASFGVPVRIHYVYRSTGVENRAPRPAYYSKDLALRSFLRAVDAAPSTGDVVFVNDGPHVPPDRVATMARAGEVVELPGVGNGGSYRFLVTMVESRFGWSPDDLVYFGEDDYLYRREAFRALVDAADSIAAASFFTLYDHPDYARLSLHRSFERRRRSSRWNVGGTEWRAVRSTTMSFASRIRDLHDQEWLHLLGSNAFLSASPHPADDYIWNASQSITGRLLVPLAFRCTNPRNGIVVNAKRAARITAEYRARRDQMLLVSPTVALATHMHLPHVAAGVDWECEAAAVSEEA
jgi:hypothetical protein